MRKESFVIILNKEIYCLLSPVPGVWVCVCGDDVSAASCVHHGEAKPSSDAHMSSFEVNFTIST